MRLKRKLKAFNECILPVMTYGCETWLLSNTKLENLVTTPKKMERIMEGVILKDRKSTNWIQKQSGVTIIMTIRESKHRWVGHMSRRTNNRWTPRVTEWIPHGHKRPRGQPRMRWCDDLIRCVGLPGVILQNIGSYRKHVERGGSSLGREKNAKIDWLTLISHVRSPTSTTVEASLTASL